MKKFLSILSVFALMALQGCNNEQPTQESQYVQPQQYTASGVSPANQPQVVYQQAPQEDHTIRDGLIGAGIGYMLGRHSNGSGSGAGLVGGQVHQPTVIRNTTIVKKVYVQPAPVRTAPRTYRPSFSATRRR